MSTYREIIYMVLDELKLSSNDRYFEEEHIIFLAEKYRALLLKQRYSDMRRSIAESNLQTICIDLNLSSTECICDGEVYLKSTTTIPDILNIGGIYSSTKVTPINVFNSILTFVNYERFQFVGYNKWLQNIIYCTIGGDKYLYLKSNNPQYKYLKQVQLTGLFESPSEAYKLQCSETSTSCNILDNYFPIESNFVPQLINMIVKELNGSIYRPKDNINDSSDELSNIQYKE